MFFDYTNGEVSNFALCIISGLLCWFCTSLGASSVFLFNKINQKTICILLSFASGVMIASSFFSLLNPAVDLCEQQNLPSFLFVALGFFVGGAFIVFSSKMLDRFFAFNKMTKHTGIKRCVIFTSSIVLHNIPEGMAIGVAFGALTTNSADGIITAFMLAVGVGIQNVPEGASVSLPLKVEKIKNGKAFGIGVLSGIVEPIFAPLAFLLCHFIGGFLPILLSFASGTMIAVATCELMPEAVEISKHRAILFMTLGFVVMALLDLAFG